MRRRALAALFIGLRFRNVPGAGQLRPFSAMWRAFAQVAVTAANAERAVVEIAKPCAGQLVLNPQASAAGAHNGTRVRIRARFSRSDDAEALRTALLARRGRREVTPPS
jgi:hypothetical protein